MNPLIKEIRTAEDAHRLFEHRDGELFWKIKPARNVNVGDMVGKNASFFKQLRYKRKTYKVHRLIWLMFVGDPGDLVIDHIDMNPLNNRLENLRLANAQQNQANRLASRTSKSGIKGVRLVGNRWHANITVNGRTKLLGTFNTPELAVSAYRDAARNAFGEFARS